MQAAIRILLNTYIYIYNFIYNSKIDKTFSISNIQIPIISIDSIYITTLNLIIIILKYIK